ncbi:hypothetical protein F4805DRAFT_458649 [Annulohypoxylon moriforme]|nr:hypothetical protein F4805DRAFT_458649 [Annulohypoxylon moriforme]
MPFSPETRRITDGEWESHKSRILQLYITSQCTLGGSNGVIETMAKEGFTATAPQYEHRFRKWKVRKNNTRAEYERLIYGSQQGGDITQVSRKISTPKLRRARRRYAPRLPQGEDSISHEHGDTTRAEGGHMSAFESETGLPSAEIDVTARIMPIDIDIDGNVSSLILPNNDLGIVDWDVDMIDETYSGFPLEVLNDFAWETHISPVGPLAVSGFSENPFDRRIYSKWPSTSTSGALTNSGDSNLLFKFLNILTGSISTSRCSTALPDLNDFYSLKVFAGEDWSQVDDLPDEVALEARFDGRLIASAINGFAGLNDVS